MPIYAIFFMIFTLASVGLPGTSGFIGEFLTIIGAFKFNIYLAFFTALGIILSVVYMLYLYKRVVFGIISNIKIKSILDLNLREIIIMVPIIVIIFLIGLFPNIFLDPMRAPLKNIIINYEITNDK